MPASVVIVHNDPEFVEKTVLALRDAGHDVVAFANSMTALDALEAAERIEVLITRANFPPGQPNGVSLGMLAGRKRPGVKVLFVAEPETQEFTEGVGEFLPASASTDEVVAKVGEILAKSYGEGGSHGDVDHH